MTPLPCTPLVPLTPTAYTNLSLHQAPPQTLTLRGYWVMPQTLQCKCTIRHWMCLYFRIWKLSDSKFSSTRGFPPDSFVSFSFFPSLTAYCLMLIPELIPPTILAILRHRLYDDPSFCFCWPGKISGHMKQHKCDFLCLKRGVSSLLHNPNYAQLADSGQRWPLIDQADGHPGYDFVIAEPGNQFNLGREN